MNRTLYVDGFNFYYGVTDHWRRHDPRLAGLGWCDFGALIRRHFGARSGLRIKYFTAPITENVALLGHRPGEHVRYSHWLRALRTIENLTVVSGFYKEFERTRPDANPKGREEKQTDVNLAVEMMLDSLRPIGERAEHVYVLSGDCDLMPAVFALQERLPAPIPVTILLPSSADKGQWSSTYNRTKIRLRDCHGIRTPEVSRPGRAQDVEVLNVSTLVNSLLPYQLQDSQGEFSCPEYWRLPEEYLAENCRTAKWRPDLPGSPSRRLAAQEEPRFGRGL